MSQNSNNNYQKNLDPSNQGSLNGDESPKNLNQGPNKKAYIITILIMVIILAGILIVGVARTHKTKSTLTSPSVSSSTKKDSVFAKKTKPTQNYTPPKAPVSAVKKGKDGSYHLNTGDEETDGSVEGAVLAVIPSISEKPNYYYFISGKFDPTYTGLAQDGLNFTAEGYPAGYYYMKNGVFQKHFKGLVSRANYMRIVINGKEQTNYNGEIHIGPKPKDKAVQWIWECENGAILNYEVGRDDNFVDPETDWELAK